MGKNFLEKWLAWVNYEDCDPYVIIKKEENKHDNIKMQHICDGCIDHLV